MNGVNAPGSRGDSRYLLSPMRVDLSKHAGPLLDVRVESSWERKNFAGRAFARRSGKTNAQVRDDSSSCLTDARETRSGAREAPRAEWPRLSGPALRRERKITFRSRRGVKARHHAPVAKPAANKTKDTCARSGAVSAVPFIARLFVKTTGCWGAFSRHGARRSSVAIRLFGRPIM